MYFFSKLMVFVCIFALLTPVSHAKIHLPRRSKHKASTPAPAAAPDQNSLADRTNTPKPAAATSSDESIDCLLSPEQQKAKQDTKQDAKQDSKKGKHSKKKHKLFPKIDPNVHAAKSHGKLGNLLKALVLTPFEISRFLKMMRKLNVEINNTRMLLSGAVTNPMSPELLNKISASLTTKIAKFDKETHLVREGAALKGIEMANNLCGNPGMSVAMAAPYIGQAVAGLCAKIAAESAKFLSLLGQADVVMTNAIEAKENISILVATSTSPANPNGAATAAVNPNVTPLAVDPNGASQAIAAPVPVN